MNRPLLHILSFFLLLLGLLSSADTGPEPLVWGGTAGSNRPWRIIDRELQWWEDRSDRQSLPEVQALPKDAWQGLKHRCCSFGPERHSIWLRFEVANRSRTDSVFLIEVVNPFIDSLVLYQVDAAGRLLRADTTGAFLPRRPYPVRDRNFLFEGRLLAESTTQFYLAIKTGYPLFLRIMLWDQDERLIHQRWVEAILLSAFFVFCLLYLLLSGILISVTRQDYQWFYFWYVAVTTVFIAAHLGLDFQFLWPQLPIRQLFIAVALNNLRLILGIEFFRRYYELPKRSRRFNQVLNVIIGLFGATTVLLLLTEWIDVARVFYVFFLYLILLNAVILGWVLYQIFRERKRRASWLFVVIMLHIVGLTSTMLQYRGYGSFDLAVLLLPFSGRVMTFFVQATVILAFVTEMILVFYFSIRRYVRLYEKNQRAQIKLARTKEAGLNALLLGVENERRRIARDLHDGACVNLAAIRMKVDALREKQPDAALADIAGDLEQTYREVRGISHDLMSSALEKIGLAAALDELIARIQQAQPGLSVQLYVNYNLEKMSGLARVNIYRIVQELLGNALRHAGATAVNVQLLQHEDQLLLTVEDNGRGFDPAALNGNTGIGLANVRTRIAVLRGSLHLETAPGKGTFISIEIPEGAIQAASQTP